MFESLSKKLSRTFEHIMGRDKIQPSDVSAAAREIRVALLEADVALPVAKELLSRIEEQAVGQKIIESVSPAQQIVKIVNDELTRLLGEKNEGLELSGKPPAAIMMVGLNGSGKTTTSAKLAKFLKEKNGKKVLLASSDVYRPQAREQLRILGERIGAGVLPIVEDEKPADIAKRAAKTAAADGYDVLILDTAGRLHVDEELMSEAKAMRKILAPAEVLLAVDALTGQDGINVARAFNDALSLTGIVITRIDGDARGGSAISMRAATGVPIKFLGAGEHLDELEPFYPDRIASRILGMGDIVSLVEHAEAKIDEGEAKALAERMFSGQFTFEDMLSQFRQMKKLGSIKGIMKFIPGIGGLSEKMQAAGVNDEAVARQEAMILSMTPRERRDPSVILLGRKKRIAAGAGVSVSEVDRLLKQYQKTKAVMEQMQKMGGMKGMMEIMKGMKDGGEPGGLPGLGQ
ncbi:MAG: signal recognition particle protein [Rickettsiales bacterium]|jgi:signal recognition particle subunit SRP54|nr:signal recognition particle protein [Rickettsiales bacterium]